MLKILFKNSKGVVFISKLILNSLIKHFHFLKAKKNEKKNMVHSFKRVSNLINSKFRSIKILSVGSEHNLFSVVPWRANLVVRKLLVLFWKDVAGDFVTKVKQINSQ